MTTNSPKGTAVSVTASSIDPRVYARRWKTLMVLSLSLVIIGLDNTVLNVALPTLQRHFDTSESTLQWIVDAYTLAFAGLLLLMGTLGDHFGRKRALQCGLAVFGAGSVLAALAQSSGELIGLRALMGIGGAMIMPATLSTVSNIFPREERGKAIAVWSATAAVGIGLGPFVGGLLLDYFSWSSVFWLNVPIVVIAFVAGLVLVPETRDPEAGRLDPLGSLLSVGALVALVYPIIEAPNKGWTSPVILGSFAASAVLGAIFVWWELRNPEPMLQLDFFRRPGFSIASLGIALAYFGLMGAIFAFTQYLQFARGYSALAAGAIMLPLVIGLVAGGGNSDRVVARLGTPRVITAGLLGLAVVLATALLWTPTTPVWVLCVTLTAMAFFMSNVMAPGTESVMSSIPESKAGVGSAMNDINRQVGGALGVAIIGSIMNSVYSGRMTQSVAKLPVSARQAARDSIGSAQAVATHLPAAAAQHLDNAAANAFTHALGIGFLSAAIAAAIAAPLVLRFVPGRSPARKAPSQVTVEAVPARV
jgi:EmrB/QacA subfamily drug resistance transporter